MVAPPRRPASAATAERLAGGQVRIIGGRWRGTTLPVVDSSGLRPTSSRVRETLFNWLAPVLPGSICVDLFAGSGALGFEAASRAAQQVLMVEREPQLAASLRASAIRLRAEQVEIHLADAISWLAHGNVPPVTIAFVDPPFERDLWNATLAALAPRLAERAWVYVESSPEALLLPPAGFALHREGRTREVSYRLFRIGSTG